MPVWVLPTLQVTALMCLVFRSTQYLQAADEAGGRFPSRFDIGWIVLLSGCLLIGAAWVVRTRLATGAPRGILSATVMLFVILIVIGGGDTLGFEIPVLLLALALVVVDVGLTAGIVAIAVLALEVAIGHVLIGSGPATILVNAFALAVLGGFGVTFGALWRSYQQTTELLQDTMEDQRRAAGTQKELVLAEERARSARDLHDMLGHRLTVIAMSLEFAERVAPREPQAAQQEVATARETALAAMEEMRTWVRALSPVRDPAARGLVAVDAIAESFRGTGLDVQVVHEGVPSAALLGEDAELLIYRSVQEGLTNALRHGRAQRVRIRTANSDQRVRLEITSDLDAAARESLAGGPLDHGFGLRGLAERATALGGSVRACRAADEVVLSVEIPATTRETR